MSILDRCESRGGTKVRLLAVHSTEGNGTAQALRDATWWVGSSHAINDETGTLLTPAEGCVPYSMASWTLRSGNHASDNIEQVGWARYTRAEWLARPKLLDGTARWLAERSKARGIPLVKLSPADVAAGKSGVIGHVDWTLGMADGTHTDPGPNYPWDVVIAAAQSYATGTAPTPGGFLMALTDQQQLDVWKGIGALVTIYTSPQLGANSEGLTRLRDIHATVAALAARDPKVTIDASAIAAAIPDDLARQVADELGKRLATS